MRFRSLEFATSAIRVAIAVALSLCLAGSGLRADDAPVQAASAMLYLANGDMSPGGLRDGDAPDMLRWQHPAFVGTFDFPRRAVRAIHFPRPAAPPQPDGEYLFELAGGDVLFGSLARMTADELELNLPGFGPVHVERPAVRRLALWRGGADLLYLGPNGLDGWEGTKPQWREEAGHLLTDQPNSFLHGNLGIPAQANIEFEISWTQKPDFVFVLGVDDHEEQVTQGFRFEVWNDDLLVIRESPDEADVAMLIKIVPGAGRVRLQAYLDQPNNRMIVQGSDGKPLGELRLSHGSELSFPGVRLVNKRGDVRLERLRISRWDGAAPPAVHAEEARLHHADGWIQYGEVQSFDAASREFVILVNGQARRVPADKATSVVFAPAETGAVSSMRALCHNGVRLSGELLNVAEGRVWLKHPAVREPLALPVEALRSLLVLEQETVTFDTKRLVGRLELAQTRLSGVLMDGIGGDGASCLVWLPTASQTSAALKVGASGRIVYRDPPPPPLPTSAGRPRPARAAGLWGGLMRAISANERAPQSTGLFQPVLHLRSGDAVPCKVQQIDERGVAFETPMSNATFVEHARVKAVELARSLDTIQIDEAKRERLLTLPRMQKQSPPTHLIRSTSGDYLRGRLTEMNGEALSVEVRLETKQLPREHVSQIIWLHADELDPSKLAPVASEAAPRVQAVRSSGTRLTFHATEVKESQLSGESDVLGSCRIDLNDVDRLLLGQAIDEAAAELTYQPWKLQNAVEPKFVTAGDGHSRPLGTESALVGQPAPEFELDLLSGGRFRLSEQRGKVIVLDFWASWCGPCMQAMPQVDGVVHEFADQGVELVAVNLQEPAEQVRATLERLRLQPQVALDIDGVVAGQYAATAIPQTVIIHRDGTVARLFIGGGSQFAEQLRGALQQVVQP